MNRIFLPWRRFLLDGGRSRRRDTLQYERSHVFHVGNVVNGGWQLMLRPLQPISSRPKSAEGIVGRVLPAYGDARAKLHAASSSAMTNPFCRHLVKRDDVPDMTRNGSSNDDVPFGGPERERFGSDQRSDKKPSYGPDR